MNPRPSSLLRAAVSAGAGTTAWNVFSRALSFAMSVLVARELGASGYGSFAVYWYAAWMLSQGTDLGLHLVSMRSLTQGASASIFWSAVTAKALLSVAVAVLAIAGVVAAPGVSLVLVLLGAHLIGTWVEFCGAVLRSQGFIAREGVLLATLRGGWLLAAGFALRNDASLLALALALVVAGLPALASAGVLARRAVRARAAATREDIRSVLAQSLPLAAGGLVTLVYLRADLFILAALRDAGEAGIFQSAFRVFEATFVLSGGIAAGTFPLLSQRFGKPRFEVLSRFLLIVMGGLGGLLAVAFALASEPIIALLFGEEFLPAAAPLSVLGIALVPVFLNALTTHLLIASGRTRRLVLALGVRLVVGVGLDVALIPSMGAFGAAIAVAAAEWALFAASAAASFDLFGLSRLSPGLSRERATLCS